ncbi:ferredoxin--NADP+ reductase [Gracilibacillus orientalis]|uniref:Ferredoxin--NADP+ reductase n=1 Tax=Gracilibacillus orientalis TaxID=334253 RepID=A0A1I4K4T6_9BACI|nr:dihydropteridine reductase [Gracilibacillus orientalis]SFL73463.1 ferredoxin--NADP+ reductase [Gracilibacillus orientalis]
MQIYWTKINKIIEETPEVKTYLLDCPEDYTWEEGSHIHLALEGFNAGDKPNRSLIRHMSISTLPHENSIGITTRIREQCSEFKSILRNMEIGHEVAIFKTHSNVPLKREDKNVYLLSSGVGLATFRPLVLDYFDRADNVNHIHSLNIDSSKDFLFTNIFESVPDKKFTSQFVDNRKEYYNEVKNLATDKAGLFYVVGSDEFLVENIEVLREQGIKPEQIMLDKHEHVLPEFLSIQSSI